MKTDNKLRIIMKDNKYIPIPTDNFSIRQNSVIYFKGSYYLYADVIEWDNPYHPASYDSSIHMYKSNDAENWEYICEVIAKGEYGEWMANGIATPGACVFKGKIYLSFSVRGKRNGMGHRTLGMSVSETPEGPFKEIPNLHIAPPEEDYAKNDQTLLLDDPYLVPCNAKGTGPGDERMYIYFRKCVRHVDKNNGISKFLEYGIWNAYTTVDDNEWSIPKLRIPVFKEEVIESIDARWIDNRLVLLCMKYNEPGSVVVYISRDSEEFYHAEPFNVGYLKFMPTVCCNLIGFIQDSDGVVRHMTMPGVTDDKGHYTMWIAKIEIE